MRVMSPKVLLIALLATVAGATSSAYAQLGQDVVAAQSISAAQQTQITDHITKNIEDLKKGTPEVIKRAKNALTSPLLEANVSVPFRLSYSEALVAAKLGDLCKDKDDSIAINALRVAGEVAENQMITLIEEALTDKRVSVRYAAAFAASRTFEQIGVPNRSIAATAGKTDSLVRNLAKVLADTKEDLLVVDGVSRAMLAAARIEEPRMASTSTAAISEVSKGLGKRIAAAGPEDKAIVESAQRAVQQMGDTFNGAAGTKVDKDARREAAGLAGDLAAWAVRQIADGKVTLDKKDPQRQHFQNVLATAENTILSAVKASGATPSGARLVPAFESATREGDASVVVQTRDWLVGGILTKAPFELPADRFKLK